MSYKQAKTFVRFQHKCQVLFSSLRTSATFGSPENESLLHPVPVCTKGNKEAADKARSPRDVALSAPELKGEPLGGADASIPARATLFAQIGGQRLVVNLCSEEGASNRRFW